MSLLAMQVSNSAVIDFMTGTPVANAILNGYRAYIHPTAPSIDASLFNTDGDETKIYIFTPTVPSTKEEDQQYTKKHQIQGSIRD